MRNVSARYCLGANRAEIDGLSRPARRRRGRGLLGRLPVRCHDDESDDDDGKRGEHHDPHEPAPMVGAQHRIGLQVLLGSRQVLACWRFPVLHLSSTIGCGCRPDDPGETPEAERVPHVGRVCHAMGDRKGKAGRPNWFRHEPSTWRGESRISAAMSRPAPAGRPGRTRGKIRRCGRYREGIRRARSACRTNRVCARDRAPGTGASSCC